MRVDFHLITDTEISAPVRRDAQKLRMQRGHVERCSLDRLACRNQSGDDAVQQLAGPANAAVPDISQSSAVPSSVVSRETGRRRTNWISGGYSKPAGPSTGMLHQVRIVEPASFLAAPFKRQIGFRGAIAKLLSYGL